MSLKGKVFFVNLITVLLFLFASGGFAAQTLTGYGADLSQTSVSGLSSGAFMTAQFHVAYSDKVIGAGIVAGGPFYCVGSYTSNPNNFVFQATSTCMAPMTSFVAPDGKGLFEKAEKFSKQNVIADVNNLKDDKVYLFSGSSDDVVKTLVVDQVDIFYKEAGVPEKSIRYNKSVNAGHSIITEDGPVPCPENKTPFINDCDFDQSHRILDHIYGNLNPPVKTSELSGKFVEFEQSEFFNNNKATSMDEKAYLYVPESCEKEKCKVHVAIHGCLQGASEIGDQYYRTTGYNEIADSNKMLVLYPQVKKSEAVPYNPLGCWDFWGYSSADPSKPLFYTREAPQMKAILGMVERLGDARK